VIPKLLEAEELDVPSQMMIDWIWNGKEQKQEDINILVLVLIARDFEYDWWQKS
jgi:hypothetical protein